MKDLKYRLNDNHHFNENIYHDAIRLLDRITILCRLHNFIPSDANLMHYFYWNKDHLNRCFQMLKEMGKVDYARNHRRTTLKFLGEYEFLNKYKKED